MDDWCDDCGLQKGEALHICWVCYVNVCSDCWSGGHEGCELDEEKREAEDGE
jgi:hypothetical protein